MQIRGLILFLWAMGFLSLFFLFASSQSRSAEVILSWTAPNDSRVAGYSIYYGTSPPEFKSRPKITINSPHQTHCTISSLKERQTYYFAAKSFDAYGNKSRFSETISYTVPGSKEPGIGEHPDSDGDGVTDAMEEAASNKGDGNADGEPDSSQAHVASLLTNNFETASHFITLEAQPPARLKNCQGVDPWPEDMPADVVFEWGIFEFAITDIPQDGSTQVILYLPQGAQPTGYRKYGPTADNPEDHWYPFLHQGRTGAEFNGNILTLHFQDAARGDNNLSADGRIIDPGGPVYEISTGSADAQANNSNEGSNSNHSGGGGGGGGGCFLNTLSTLN